MLEQRIAQLEADAREQDMKAQGILANVQARFNSVQSKYETHIADLETQVLSLQEINSKLNEKIIKQIDELYKMNQRNDKKNLITNFTQTDEIPEKEIKTRSISVQTARAGSTTASATNPPRKSVSAGSRLSNSHSDSSIQNKEDAHLLATIRGMRVDLAIKDKAVQRLTREIEECKKTIRKLQKERDAYLKPSDSKTSSASSNRKSYDPAHFSENVDAGHLKDALGKIKQMEADYKALHDKRLQDVSIMMKIRNTEIGIF